MALPKENPEVENQLEGFVSKPDEPAASAATQLDPLLNLLFDLKIIAGSKQQNPEPEADSSGKNGQAGTLGGSIDLLGISSPQPEEISPQQNPEPEADSSDNSQRKFHRSKIPSPKLTAATKTVKLGPSAG
ncbi:MAG: hypothetical protein JGK40_21845 [Microcoleus sp. PH2017_21_RUC_O_A]|uniref:hypothetical protein n=1 Tax=Microcoleus sp. PH2017_21_RUC_O_A TaxID=2798832 RepID=UPI001D857083|nr:hypothetical protein [Microcoleus sp. PH2017_21_RUC_O_A]MCC3530649.1 hypothetical protein [Microcoleus sp. PH2017_21_RUC_O_A]